MQPYPDAHSCCMQADSPQSISTVGADQNQRHWTSQFVVKRRQGWTTVARQRKHILREQSSSPLGLVRNPRYQSRSDSPSQNRIDNQTEASSNDLTSRIRLPATGPTRQTGRGEKVGG